MLFILSVNMLSERLASRALLASEERAKQVNTGYTRTRDT